MERFRPLYGIDIVSEEIRIKDRQIIGLPAFSVAPLSIREQISCAI